MLYIGPDLSELVLLVFDRVLFDFSLSFHDSNTHYETLAFNGVLPLSHSVEAG